MKKKIKPRKPDTGKRSKPHVSSNINPKTEYWRIIKKLLSNVDRRFLGLMLETVKAYARQADSMSKNAAIVVQLKNIEQSRRRAR